jgi:hypothetical protein
MLTTPVPELIEISENSSVCDFFEEPDCDFCEFSRHPDLEYDDMQPDEDGLTFSEYHNLEW